MSNSMLREFLDGITVLDFSQNLPGPFCSLLLADMGATIIKIEPPIGDPLRSFGQQNEHGESAFYRAVNAGKLIIRCDLKDADRTGVRELIKLADVIIEGFRPGVMSRLGVDYMSARAIKADIIYCSISGYGQNGSTAVGHDTNFLAEAGVLDRNGCERPSLLDPPIADVGGSLFAALAICGALRNRDRGHGGCQIDLALADIPMPLQIRELSDYSITRQSPQRGHTWANGGAAYYNVYETADGRNIAVGAVEKKFWTAFCNRAVRPDWIDRHSDPLPQTELITEISEFFSRFTFAECIDRFVSEVTCVSPVFCLGEALERDRVKDRGLVARGGDGMLQALFPALVDGHPPNHRIEPQEVSLSSVLQRLAK